MCNLSSLLYKALRLNPSIPPTKLCCCALRDNAAKLAT